MTKYKYTIAFMLFGFLALVFYSDYRINQLYRSRLHAFEEEVPILMVFHPLESFSSGEDWFTVGNSTKIFDLNVMDDIWNVIIKPPKYTDLGGFEHFEADGGVVVEVFFKSGKNAGFQVGFGEGNTLTIGLLIDKDVSRKYYSPGRVWTIFRGQGKDLGAFLHEILPMQKGKESVREGDGEGRTL